jgi:tagaturonate reductase
MKLNKKNLSLIAEKGSVPVGPVEDFPEKIVQFGEGNFLRAFIDWMINEMNKAGEFNGKAVVVQPLENGMCDMLNDQEGLYTLLLRGIDNGHVVEKAEIITSVSRAINPYLDYQEFISLSHQPELRIIISNTTEAGIEYKKTDMPVSECPASYPAKVAIFLYERFKYFHGSPDKGMLIMPCELIEENGNNLKRAILQHAADWKLGNDFAEWIENSNHFYNTLVDRIVPGFPKEEYAALTERLGYEDSLIDTGEAFHFFVIEGDEKYKSETPFSDKLLNIKWTNNQQPYRTRKVRILNGAHTLSVLAAYLSGRNTVREMVEDNVFGKLIRKAVFDEIIPTIELPQKEKEEFANSVLERFLNPFIRHLLLTISLNSISKFKVRVLPSLLQYREIKGVVPDNLSFALAALIAFYKGEYNEQGKYTGIRGNDVYEICDGGEVLDFFNQIWHESAEDYNTLTVRVLSNEKFWGRDLTSVDGLSEKTAAFLAGIMEDGVINTINKFGLTR